MLTRLSRRCCSLHAIGSFFLWRHGKQQQQRRPFASSSISCSTLDMVRCAAIISSLLVWTLLVLLQQNTLRRHSAHLPRSLVAATLAESANDSARCIVCCVIVVASSIIFSSICLLLRLQHFNRFQHESAVASTASPASPTAADARFSLSCKMDDVAISAAFCSSANFFAPRLQHEHFFNRRHGRHNADA